MKLTNGDVYDAIMGLASIIRRPRQIPQLAKFKIARMHDALEPIYKSIEDQRIAIVQQFGRETFKDEGKIVSTGWKVEEDSPEFKDYLAAWDKIRAQEVEVNITPITLQSLGESEQGVEAGEFKYLGKLVVDVMDNPVPLGVSGTA